MCEWILEHEGGSLVHAENDKFETPLLVAGNAGHIIICELLMKCYQLPNAPFDGYGDLTTTLHVLSVRAREAAALATSREAQVAHERAEAAKKQAQADEAAAALTQSRSNEAAKLEAELPAKHVERAAATQAREDLERRLQADAASRAASGRAESREERAVRLAREEAELGSLKEAEATLLSQIAAIECRKKALENEAKKEVGHAMVQPVRGDGLNSGAMVLSTALSTYEDEQARYGYGGRTSRAQRGYRVPF